MTPAPCLKLEFSAGRAAVRTCAFRGTDVSYARVRIVTLDRFSILHIQYVSEIGCHDQSRNWWCLPLLRRLSRVALSTSFTHSSMTSLPTRHVFNTTPLLCMISSERAHRRFQNSSFLLYGAPGTPPSPPAAGSPPVAPVAHLAAAAGYADKPRRGAGRGGGPCELNPSRVGDCDLMAGKAL